MYFTGSVEQGISLLKEKNCCLLMFIYGSDAVSNSYSEYIESEDLKPILKDNFLAMKLECTSNSAMDFSAFYPVVCVPTVYIISPAGVALEVVIGDCTLSVFMQRIQKAVALFKKEDDNKNCDAVSATGGADAPEAWEERVATVEEKIKIAQAIKEKERQEKLKQEEIDRRTAGRSLGRLRQTQMETEEKERIEEVRRERLARTRALQGKSSPTSTSSVPTPPQTEDSLAPDIQSVRDQKKAGYYSKKEAQENEVRRKQEQESAQVTELQRKANEERLKRARIQFRCADGRVFVRDLPGENTLQQLYDSAAPEAAEPKGFRLATVYPRRVFEAADMSQTLSQLELTPSANLLILPPVSTSYASPGYSVSLLRPVWELIRLVGLPFTILFQMIMNIISPTTPTPNTATPSADNQRPPANKGSTTHRGNTMRLHNLPKDDDKDRPTWNGNSTQQM